MRQIAKQQRQLGIGALRAVYIGVCMLVVRSWMNNSVLSPTEHGAACPDTRWVVVDLGGAHFQQQHAHIDRRVLKPAATCRRCLAS